MYVQDVKIKLYKLQKKSYFVKNMYTYSKSIITIIVIIIREKYPALYNHVLCVRSSFSCCFLANSSGFNI